jgi:hypothetical protein
VPPAIQCRLTLCIYRYLVAQQWFTLHGNNRGAM